MGTSGVRAVCIDADLTVVDSAQTAFAEHEGERNRPATWLLAVSQVIREILSQIDADSIAAIAIDGTSGTLIATDKNGVPVSDARMYNDKCDEKNLLDQIATHAPNTSAAHGASSGLAKAMQLSRLPDASCIQHEADWITAALSGKTNITDENNALKTGYDPVNTEWPEWIAKTRMDMTQLPGVMRAGQPIGPAIGHLAKTLKLSPDTLVVAGTTDGCASFMATGAKDAGDGVTVLGSTMTLKILSAKPIFAPQYGIYSHKVGDTWLAGGASNTGGAVLAHFFNATQLVELSDKINLSETTSLDYYPLIKPGERFPINDSALEPQVTPRPSSDTDFLYGLLQGIADIEKLGYQRLEELGGPKLTSLRAVGGGATNATWIQIRRNAINVPFVESLSGEAAFGSAVLAKKGAAEFAATS